MRRSTTLLLLVFVVVMFALAFLTGCGSSNATTPEAAQPASIGYARLPDGRVLTCISSDTYASNTVYNCDWSHPFSTNGTAPVNAKIRIIESFEYVKVPSGDTLQCVSFATYASNRVTECDWGHPVKPS